MDLTRSTKKLDSTSGHQTTAGFFGKDRSKKKMVLVEKITRFEVKKRAAPMTPLIAILLFIFIEKASGLYLLGLYVVSDYWPYGFF